MNSYASIPVNLHFLNVIIQKLLQTLF